MVQLRSGLISKLMHAWSGVRQGGNDKAKLLIRGHSEEKKLSVLSVDNSSQLFNVILDFVAEQITFSFSFHSSH